MKVTLLRDLGDYKKGAVLEIHDETVISKWKEIDVIANDNRSKDTKEEEAEDKKKK